VTQLITLQKLPRSNSGLLRRARREWAKQDSDRKAHLKHAYGLTLDQYDELFKAQQGACAICHQITKRLLFVDHDHKTGKARGLLCVNCNNGLGLLGDHVETVQRAANYLKQHGR